MTETITQLLTCPRADSMSIAAETRFFGDFDAMDPMMGKHHHHEDSFEWNGVHEYASQLSSPAQEYGSYGFGSVPGQEIPQDHQFNRPMYSMPDQQPQPVYPAQWPSMLTNPSMPQHIQHHQHPGIPQQQPPPPPQHQIHMQQMSVAPAIAPMTMQAPHPLPPLNTTPAPHPTPQRRTLTDQDRRRMCQYHEDNPSVKQTEIGAMFGVERSTVSKVLRNKDKYLFSDEGSRSPMKKSKGKFPDIERALSNWVRNHERKGMSLSDKDIRDKARFFANTVGNVESYDKLNSNSWLEKFKQKNNLVGKARKGSDANDSDIGTGNVSESQTPNGISPVSPSALTSPSPISPSQSMEKLRMEASNAAMGKGAQQFSHMHSMNGTSMATDQSDTTAPAGPTFLPDMGADHGFTGAQHQHMMMAQANANSHRIRSQTFPVLGINPNFDTSVGGAGNLTPKQMQEMMSNASLETSIEDYSDRGFGGDIRHASPTSSSNTPAHGSPAMMAPPHGPISQSVGSSSLSSPIVPPSQDEARKALELVMQFFQNQPNGVVDAEEYITMGKLMEKLKVQGQVGGLPGGMHSIDVPHQDLGRKRSINSL